MSDLILMTGDAANFLPLFGPAVVVVRPGPLQGSGPNTFNGKPVCVAGDESTVAVPGCCYITPVYSIPGTGTLKIDALAGDQIAAKTQTGGKAVLLKGSMFTARFDVETPAKEPVLSSLDPTPRYSGAGTFQTANLKYRGT